MANRVFLHVGTPKSGTTYVQAVLGANRQRLAAQADLLYPGPTWAAQVRAARDILDMSRSGPRDPAVDGAWKRLVDEIGGWHGDAVVSMEWLGSARPVKARRMVESLAPAQVEIVVTARDLARTIPAAWQEFVQNWHTWTWPEFLASITSDNPRATPAGGMFWVQQDLNRLFAVWRDLLPASQVHLVTLPPAGAPAGELWTRFASVLGVDPRRYDSTGGGGNESLGLESAELMRRLNDASRLANLEPPVYDEWFKTTLAKRGLSDRKPRESSLAVPEDIREWLLAYSAEQLEAVRASGVHLVGELSDLEPVLRPGGTQPHEVDDASLLAAAVDGLVFLARDRGAELTRLRTANQRVRDRNAALRAELDTARRELDTARRERDAVQQRVVADERRPSARAVRLLRRGYRAGTRRLGERRLRGGGPAG